MRTRTFLLCGNNQTKITNLANSKPQTLVSTVNMFFVLTKLYIQHSILFLVACRVRQTLQLRHIYSGQGHEVTVGVKKIHNYSVFSFRRCSWTLTAGLFYHSAQGIAPRSAGLFYHCANNRAKCTCLVGRLRNLLGTTACRGDATPGRNHRTPHMKRASFLDTKGNGLPTHLTNYLPFKYRN